MKEIMIIRMNESVISSWLKDIFSIGLLLLGFYINFHYLGNGLILQILFAIGLIGFGMKHSLSRSQTFTNKIDAISYVEKLFEVNNGK